MLWVLEKTSQWDGSFEHPKHMSKLIDKEKITILAQNFCLMFVCFVALRPKSTAMVIAGRSVHLTTLFSWASLNKQLTSNRAHTFACNWQQPFMNDSAEGRRMTVEIISWSISTKVWDRAGIELATPGSAVSFASVTRHVADCATRPGFFFLLNGTYELYSVFKIFDWWFIGRINSYFKVWLTVTK